MIRFFNTYEPVTDFYRDLIPALASAGLASEVVMSATEYRSGRSQLKQVFDGLDVRIAEMPSPVGRADSTLKKLGVIASYAPGAALRAAFGPHSQVNLFLTQPPVFSVLGRALRATRKQKYCCLVMDLYPHVLVADGKMSEASIQFRVLRSLMRKALQDADAVFVIGRCMRDRLVEEGVDSSRIVVTHNWAHESRVYPVGHRQNHLRQSLGYKEEDFVVLYSGNMGIGHEFETITEVVERLQDRADIHFLFIGGGARRARLEQSIKRRKLVRAQVIDYQSESDLHLSQSIGDVHFVCLRPQFSGLIVPSKSYSTFAAGRALIYEGSAQDEIARVVTEHDIGESVPYRDAEALRQAVLGMANDRAAAAAAGARARALVLSGELGRSGAIRQYVDTLLQVARAGRSVEASRQ